MVVEIIQYFGGTVNRWMMLYVETSVVCCHALSVRRVSSKNRAILRQQRETLLNGSVTIMPEEVCPCFCRRGDMPRAGAAESGLFSNSILPHRGREEIMEETRYKINLDVQQGGVQETLTGFRVGDALSRTVCIHLVERGASYSVPEGSVVTLYARKPDGTVSYSQCSVSGGAAEHTFTSGELAAAGEVLCEVRITTGGETPAVLSSPQFSVIVEDVLQDDGAIASTDEYSALTQAIAEMEDLCEATEAATQSANTAAETAQAAAQGAADAASQAQGAAEAANNVVEGMQETLAKKPTSYVLQWTDAQYEEYEGIMAQNEVVLETLYGAEEGSYHLVLKNGDKEYALSRREHTSAGRYEFCFLSEVVSSFTPYEYVVWYEPGNKLEEAESGLQRRNVVNSEDLGAYDFRPPTTDLVRLFLDMHTEDADIHITPEERSKWNAGTGGGVTYTLSKTGSTIKLAGNDGSEQTVTDDNTTYGAATTGAAGLMSASDKTKLDGIAAGANNYVHPTYATRESGLYKITVDGTGHVALAQAVTQSDITPLLDMDAIIAAFPDATEVEY